MLWAGRLLTFRADAKPTRTMASLPVQIGPLWLAKNNVLPSPRGGWTLTPSSVKMAKPCSPMATLGEVDNDNKVTQAIAELIRLHDDVLARVFALQTLLQELDLVSPDQVQDRTEQFRRQFASDLEARLAALQEKTVGKRFSSGNGFSMNLKSHSDRQRSE